jgi:hypothetical protein
MRPMLSPLSARLLFLASVVIAIPVVAVLSVMTLLGAAAMGLIASLHGARRQRAGHDDGPLVIDGEYTVVEARSVPLRSPLRR